MTITPQDIAVALGRTGPTAEEDAQWQLWVDDAYMLIDFRKDALEIIDEWWELLGLTSPSAGVYAIDTAYGAGVHAEICALNFGSLYCSCGADLTNYAYPLWELP
jgi:hypothetical protein